MLCLRDLHGHVPCIYLGSLLYVDQEMDIRSLDIYCNSRQRGEVHHFSRTTNNPLSPFINQCSGSTLSGTFPSDLLPTNPLLLCTPMALLYNTDRCFSKGQCAILSSYSTQIHTQQQHGHLFWLSSPLYMTSISTNQHPTICLRHTVFMHQQVSVTSLYMQWLY